MAEVAAARRRLCPAGYFALSADWRLDGWCWFADAPTIRPDIDITVNGAIVRRCVASQLNEALRDSGVGDGRYGFALSIPAEAAWGDAVVDAVERRSGLILGRVVFGTGADGAMAERLDRVGGEIVAAGQTVREPSPRAARIGRAMEAFGAELAARGRPHCGRPRGGGTDGLALGRAGAPAISLVVLTDDWSDAEAALRHARSLLPEVEALVIAAGAATLAAAVRAGAAAIWRWGSLAQACNESALRARAPVLWVIDAPRDFLATGIAATATGPRFGSGAAGQLAGSDVRWLAPARADGIAAVLALADLHAAGGFDADACGGIDWAGLAAKLIALGRGVDAAPWRPAAPRVLMGGRPGR